MPDPRSETEDDILKDMDFEEDGGEPAPVDQPEQPAAPEASGEGEDKKPAAPAPAHKPSEDLLDAQGQVVAKAGPERRLYERTQQLTRALEGTRAETDELKKQLAEARATNNIVQQHGLSLADADAGLQLVKQFKQRPIDVARHILQETMKLGHSLNDIIGQGGGPQSLDMRAMTQLLDERLGPLQRREDEAQKQREIEERAQREYTQFLVQHEHADLHEPVIVALMQRENLAPSAAYYKMQAWAYQNGLDFSQPLGPQIQARRSNPQGAQKPMSPGSDAGAITTQEAVPFASADDDWDSIVKQQMRANGLAV